MIDTGWWYVSANVFLTGSRYINIKSTTQGHLGITYVYQLNAWRKFANASVSLIVV